MRALAAAGGRVGMRHGVREVPTSHLVLLMRTCVGAERFTRRRRGALGDDALASLRLNKNAIAV
ncbi:hypothetical protein GCM10020218_104080 [Dactylosporangium vinaceum]